jgi:hypothetical protein
MTRPISLLVLRSNPNLVPYYEIDLLTMLIYLSRILLLRLSYVALRGFLGAVNTRDQCLGFVTVKPLFRSRGSHRCLLIERCTSLVALFSQKR